LKIVLQCKNYYLTLVFGISLCLFASVPTLANELDYRYKKAFKVQRLSLKEGLSQSGVQTIMQDRDGYIWLGTEDGLNRFDSYEFKIYRNDLRNANSLHENSVMSLLEQPSKGIWVGTIAGLSLFNPKTETFTYYSENYPRLKTGIRNLFLSKDNTVWIASDKGLYNIDKHNGKIKMFTSDIGLKFDFPAYDIAQKNHFLYVSGKRCLFKIDLRTNNAVNLCRSKIFNPLNKVSLTVLIFQNESLWIGSKNGLFQLNLDTNQLYSFHHADSDSGSISDNFIQDFVLDENGLLWIATTQGVNLYNKNKEVFEHYKYEKNSETGLSNNDIVSLFIDKEKLVWLGTYSGGVNILDPKQHQFEHLFTKNDAVDLGNNTAIHGIVKDRYESLWLASYGGGLIHYDLLTGKISRPLNDQNINYDRYVWTVMVDHQDRLWQSSISELNIIDVKTLKKIETQFIVDGDIKPNMEGVNRIFEDRMGQIWIASSSGFFKCDSITMIDDQLMISMTNLTSSLPKTYTSFDSSIATITQDQNGNLWLGGRSGLIFYDIEANQWFHFIHKKDNPKSLTNTDVQVIFVDSFGTVWVGTTSGLNKVVINQNAKRQIYFDRITRYDGIPNDTIYGVLEDKKGKIWLSTNLGVVKYSENKNEIEAYRSSDGLSSDEFNLGAYYSDDKGILYFGSIEGVTTINPITKATKNRSENIVFSKVKIGERIIDTYQLNHDEKPQLLQRKNETSIDISVANISYSKLNTQRYRYRIVGFDGKWNYLGIRRSIIIASLPQGNYILEVQSRSSDQSWQGGVKQLYLRVETNFWNSRKGFYTIVLILVLFYLASLMFLSRFYKKSLQSLSIKSKLSNLRLKETKLDSELMLHELGEREKHLSILHQKLDIASKRLDSQKFKDVTSGFYRINYLNRVIKDKIVSQADSNEIEKRQDYYSLAILELNDYVRIHQQQGPLIVSEFISKIAELIKQKIDAGSQVFTIHNGVYLVLSKEQDNLVFKSKLLNLREHILRSYFDIANGISESTKISLSLLNLHNTHLNTFRNLPLLIDALVQIHRLNNDSVEGKVIEVLGAEQSADFIFDIKSENVIKYIQAGNIKYHIIVS